MYIDFLIFSYLYLIILIMLIMAYKYMLVVLMVIEFLILNFFMIIYMIFNLMNLDLFAIYYLVYSVCESVLGLALLILIIRFHGNELYYFLHVNKF
uniref:NADH dehydrogenase subunit 4L n=1 Tax=Acropyga panamensis TaxID=602222 RepID=A0A6G5NIK6_9HYME|nr:NADH dehydrogenase subunit 4L [Acropyga panamensis]QBG38672.1 NADH dehydrogenase subunit 4L [Acropyga panamensis]